MKIKSVSGITCYVRDLARTAKFYEALGFEIRKREADHITAYSNWFWIDFIASAREARAGYQKEAASSSKGAGQFIYVSVEDVDAFYKGLTAKGIKPQNEPRDWPSGNREFVLQDPDGYNLAIFRRK